MRTLSSHAPPEPGEHRSQTPRTHQLRQEPRRELLRIVEYAPFPRTRGGERERRGSTRNLSSSGLCLQAESAEPVGSLLRVAVCRVDGRPALQALVRVAWSRSEAHGGCRMGLALVAGQPPSSPGPVR